MGANTLTVNLKLCRLKRGLGRKLHHLICLIKTLFKMGKCMLLDSKLPDRLWNYAKQTAAYARNQCYSNRTKKTLYEDADRQETKHVKNFKNLDRGVLPTTRYREKQVEIPVWAKYWSIGYD